MRVKGLAASAGAAVGSAHVYRPFVPEITQEIIAEENRGTSEKALLKAKENACAELKTLADRLTAAGSEESAIFEAHLELADDEDLWQEILDEAAEGVNPAAAVDDVFGQYIALMSANSDARMRERAADLKDVRSRVLRNLAGIPEQNLSRLPGPVIVVAHDLFPADTATMDRDNVLAIVTEVGGLTSHSAILARSYGIPAVLGVADAMACLKDGMCVAVDGESGEVIVQPDEAEQNEFRSRSRRYREKKQRNAVWQGKAGHTKDGAAIQFGVNIGEVSADSLRSIENADLVGLFRTEFLYMQSGDRLPTEEEQFEAYKKLLVCAGEKPVVLRTLDIGGDKELACMDLPKEENPFLGKRALRLCMARKDLFRCQLRAALRASVFGTLWIMFPMVSTMEDWRNARAFADEVIDALRQEGTPVAETVKFGIMIEVPAIALMSREAAKEVDFASIGTNDLCQYTLAVDRGNPDLAAYYQMYSPAVFRLIAMVAEAFRTEGKPLCVCGEMGGDEAAAMVLAGLGIGKLSMRAGAISDIKAVLAEKTTEELKQIAAQAMRCATAAETEAYLKSIWMQES